jgi:hypothetical protein
MSKVLPRDLEPGMKVERLNSDIEIVFVEVGRVSPIKVGGRIKAYRVTSQAWLDNPTGIQGDRSRRHLAPFVLQPTSRIEVQS